LARLTKHSREDSSREFRQRRLKGPAVGAGYPFTLARDPFLLSPAFAFEEQNSVEPLPEQAFFEVLGPVFCDLLADEDADDTTGAGLDLQSASTIVLSYFCVYHCFFTTVYPL